MPNFWVIFENKPFPVSKKLGTTELKLLKNLTLILVLFLVRYFSTLTLNKVKVCRKVCSYKKKSKNNIFVFMCFSTEFSDVSCPITFLTFKNFFFSKRIWKKKKKSWEEDLNHRTGHEPTEHTNIHIAYFVTLVWVSQRPLVQWSKPWPRSRFQVLLQKCKQWALLRVCPSPDGTYSVATLSTRLT